MGRYYPPDYYEKEFAENPGYHQKRYAREARYLREIEERGGSRRLLDVGCANGDFPRFMAARGWDVEGVEVSRSASPIRDFVVYSQPFPEIPIETPSYDAVTAWAVLEHVHSPMAYFQKAAKVLKPGGIFVFLVPNSDSLASRHLFCEDVPRHLFFFTRQTVKQYLQRSEFRLEHESNRGNIFRVAPENWLLYFLRTRVLGKRFSWADRPLSRPEFIQKNRLQPGFISSVRYAFNYPLRVVERPFWPVLGLIQMVRMTYPVSTFVARKIPAGGS
ncbi:MAG: hypothetical protein DMG27_04765 [Acidobacteria bacterium]|nr:MAG: hypothetical protein DMG27_04765 [Acidobacteriota bacterium]